MEPITSVQELIENFDDADPLEQAKIIKNIDIPLTNLLEYASWKANDYTRNCLAKTDDYEFILLCWEGNSETAIHDHAGQNCWVHQLSGSVLETRYSVDNKELKIDSIGTLNPGQVSYMNDTLGYHKIENNSSKRAMTLHVYVKPITACQVLNEETECFESKEMTYDQVHEVSVDEMHSS